MILDFRLKIMNHNIVNHKSKIHEESGNIIRG